MEQRACQPTYIQPRKAQTPYLRKHLGYGKLKSNSHGFPKSFVIERRVFIQYPQYSKPGTEVDGNQSDEKRSEGLIPRINQAHACGDMILFKALAVSAAKVGICVIERH